MPIDYISESDRHRTYELGPGLFTDPSGETVETHRGTVRISRLRSVYEFVPDMVECVGSFECNRPPASCDPRVPPAIGTLASTLAGQFAAYSLPDCRPITFPSAYVSQWRQNWPHGVVHCDFRAFPTWTADQNVVIFRLGAPALERMFRRVELVISTRAIESLSHRDGRRLIAEHLLRADFDLNMPWYSVNDEENRRQLFWQVRPVFTPPAPASHGPHERLDRALREASEQLNAAYARRPEATPAPEQPVDLAALNESLVNDLFAGPDDGPLHIARIDGEGGFRMVPSEN